METTSHYTAITNQNILLEVRGTVHKEQLHAEKQFAVRKDICEKWIFFFLLCVYVLSVYLSLRVKLQTKRGCTSGGVYVPYIYTPAR